MTLLLAAHLALAAGYAGVQWTVRGLVYPQLRLVPPSAFVAFHEGHSRRIARIVGPLFAGQLGTTAWLLLDRPAGTALAPVLVGAGCLAVVLLSTGLLAVPQHGRLGEGWDPTAYRRLLRADTLRVVAAGGSGLAALWAAAS